MKKPVLSQYIGCVLGQALGDTLGSPVEGYPGYICGPYTDELRSGKFALRGRKNAFAFGQYTDDTQLMRELLQSYTSQGGFSPEDYAKRIQAIFDEERIVGYGRATLEAVNNLRQGIHWKSAGAKPPAAGNGSAMRAAAVGLMAYDDPKKLIELSTNQGIITHQDPRCSAGAIAISGGVALALQGVSEASSFCQTLASWMRPLSEEFAGFVEVLPQQLSMPPQKAFMVLERAGRPVDYYDEWNGTIPPFVVPSVLWSLYSFLKSPESYWETICTSIWPGGDVDSTAAMAGAISGAFLGESALPAELLPHLNDRGTWRTEELRSLAEETFRQKHP